MQMQYVSSSNVTIVKSSDQIVTLLLKWDCFFPDHHRVEFPDVTLAAERLTIKWVAPDKR